MILYLSTFVSEYNKSHLTKSSVDFRKLMYFMKGEHMALTNESPFVVCIDSDGCAMDTMDIKHIRFFGPLAAKYFGIQNKDVYLKEWNRVNLFSETRGINRFKGLLLSLEFAKAHGEEIEDFTMFANWCNHTTSLSNQSLQEEIKKHDDAVLVKALEWSQAVNHGIETELVGEDKPFEGVREALEEISKVAQIAIVSSANSEAVNSEWKRHELMPFVSEFFGQERGSKAAAIKEIRSQGFDPHKILMVGDAPGDLDAAKVNEVHFYPILFGKEKESWSTLVTKILQEFLEGRYNDEEYQAIYHKHLSQFKS